jgi:hypothetical protein
LFLCVFVCLVFILSTLFLFFVLFEVHKNGKKKKGAIQVPLECHCGHQFAVLTSEVTSRQIEVGLQASAEGLQSKA